MLCSTDWLVVVLGQTAWPSKMVPIDCPITNLCCLTTQKSQHLIYAADEAWNQASWNVNPCPGRFEIYSCPSVICGQYLKFNVFNRAGVLNHHEKNELQWLKVVNYCNTISWTYDSERMHCFQQGWLSWKWQTFSTSINQYN